MSTRSEPPQAADHSTPELVKQLADDSATLVRQEIELAKSEMSEKIDELKAEVRWSLQEGRTVTSENLDSVKGEASAKTKVMGAAAGLYGAGGVIGLLALGSLTGALILALDGVMPNWAAALLVGAVYLLVAYLLYRSGKERMRKATPFLSPSTISRVKSSYEELAERRKTRVVEALPVPEQTIETLKEDKEWLKSPKLSGRR
jgi:hypothetical protein